jgi:ribosomal protein L11 methyltransferase
MLTKIVALHYSNKVPTEKLQELELFAETIGATIDIPFFKEMPEFLDINIFIENTPHIDQKALEKELKRITGLKKALEPVYENDWQQDCINSFPPIEIGSYFIHSFDETCDDKEKICLKIPAQMAFGTGEHATTKGCLELYEKLKEDGFRFENILDMGCGSSILAMAAYKKDKSNILAVDNDEPSIRISTNNLLVNNIREGITLLHGDGFEDEQVQETGPYDLIFANILKNPLLAMADDLVESLDEEGIAILSGFKEGSQTEEIISKYVDELGLVLIEEFTEDGWSTLALKKVC